MSDVLPVIRRGDVGSVEAIIDARQRFAALDLLGRAVAERVADGVGTWTGLCADVGATAAEVRPALQEIVAADPWWSTGPYCLR